MSNGQRAEQLTPLQNAVYLLKQTQAKLAACQEARREPIAIIGEAAGSPAAQKTPRRFGGCSATARMPSRKSRPTAGTLMTITMRIPRRRAR